jgi:hypothetical protein
LPKSNKKLTNNHRSTTPNKFNTTKRSNSASKSNIDSSNTKPRLSRCLSNTSSKRNLLLKSLQRDDLNLNCSKDIPVDTSIDSNNFNLNTKKLRVNLTSEENVKNLMRKKDDLLSNIHNIELEIETAMQNISSDDTSRNNTQNTQSKNSTNNFNK